jgi:hypothetical protein
MRRNGRRSSVPRPAAHEHAVVTDDRDYRAMCGRTLSEHVVGVDFLSASTCSLVILICCRRWRHRRGEGFVTEEVKQHPVHCCLLNLHGFTSDDGQFSFVRRSWGCCSALEPQLHCVKLLLGYSSIREGLECLQGSEQLHTTTIMRTLRT